MKKLFVILILVAMVFMLVSCGNPATEMSNMFGYFVKIKDYADESTSFVYDPVTHIVYVTIESSYRAGITPYYTIINGKPEIAIYMVNWTEAQLP